jgi:hypothetical protein
VLATPGAGMPFWFTPQLAVTLLYPDQLRDVLQTAWLTSDMLALLQTLIPSINADLVGLSDMAQYDIAMVSENVVYLVLQCDLQLLLRGVTLLVAAVQQHDLKAPVIAALRKQEPTLTAKLCHDDVRIRECAAQLYAAELELSDTNTQSLMRAHGFETGDSTQYEIDDDSGVTDDITDMVNGSFLVEAAKAVRTQQNGMAKHIVDVDSFKHALQQKNKPSVVSGTASTGDLVATRTTLQNIDKVIELSRHKAHVLLEGSIRNLLH